MEIITHQRLHRQLIKLAPGDKWEESCEKITFVFPLTGSGRVGSGSDDQSLSAGDALVLNGKSGIQLSSQAKAGMSFGTFFISIEDLFPLFTCLEILSLPAIRENLRKWKHFPAASRTAIECHQLLAKLPPDSCLSHRSQLLGVVAVILDEEFQLALRSRNGLSRVQDHTIAVLKTLTLEQVLELPSGELAARFGCSRRHLNRTFNHQFGLSVAGVRLELRLLKAAALLRNPEAKITNVGLECGFNHTGLFNHCFKRRFGITPGKWRELEGDLQHPSPTPAAVACSLRRVGLCPLSETSETKIARDHAVNAIGGGRLASTLAGTGPIVDPNKSVPPGATRLGKRGNGL